MQRDVELHKEYEKGRKEIEINLLFNKRSLLKGINNTKGCFSLSQVRNNVGFEAVYFTML